ncbi:MAG: hypothetical protein AAFY36_17795 [Bacteroidota bacterium]
MEEVTLVVRNSKEVTARELDEMHGIYRMIDPNMPDDHILINHIQTSQPVFHLFKLQGAISAFQAFTLFRVKTPFARKPLPVVYINLSYKRPEAGREVKDFARKSNLRFIKETFGSFWYTKRFVNVLQSYNPKLIQRLSDHFPLSYPSVVEPTPKEVVAFGKDLFRNKLLIDYADLDDALVKQYEYPQPSQITKRWASHYRSKDQRFNAWFQKHKIVVEAEGEVYLSGRAVFFIGYYDPVKLVGLKWRTLLGMRK